MNRREKEGGSVCRRFRFKELADRYLSLGSQASAESWAFARLKFGPCWRSRRQAADTCPTAGLKFSTSVISSTALRKENMTMVISAPQRLADMETREHINMIGWHLPSRRIAVPRCRAAPGAWARLWARIML